MFQLKQLQADGIHFKTHLNNTVNASESNQGRSPVGITRGRILE